MVRAAQVVYPRPTGAFLCDPGERLGTGEAGGGLLRDHSRAVPPPVDLPRAAKAQALPVGPAAVANAPDPGNQAQQLHCPSAACVAQAIPRPSA
jgi:hypothetical protein